MFGTSTMKKQESSPYATRKDFCRIFEKNMSPLYLLSFLLTGNEATAEQCFVGGLHIAQEGNFVFKEWAESWARRTIVLNAIRMIRPRLTSEPTAVAEARRAEHPSGQQPEISAVIELPAFERFTFVMSALEGYSDHECSLHLNCTVGDVRAARSRALERMGKSAEVHSKLVTIAPRRNALQESSESRLHLEIASRLAVPA
jgi:DNA-directed RNA polymerase specialized sigma24 family protein